MADCKSGVARVTSHRIWENGLNSASFLQDYFPDNGWKICKMTEMMISVLMAHEGYLNKGMCIQKIIHYQWKLKGKEKTGLSFFRKFGAWNYKKTKLFKYLLIVNIFRLSKWVQVYCKLEINKQSKIKKLNTRFELFFFFQIKFQLSTVDYDWPVVGSINAYPNAVHVHICEYNMRHTWPPSCGTA